MLPGPAGGWADMHTAALQGARQGARQGAMATHRVELMLLQLVLYMKEG